MEIQLPPGLGRLRQALKEAPKDPDELERWLREVPEESEYRCEVGNCGAVLTRGEALSGRCTSCLDRYFEAAGKTCEVCEGSGWELFHDKEGVERARRCSHTTIASGGADVELAKLRASGVPESYWQMTRATADPWQIQPDGGSLRKTDWPAEVERWVRNPSGCLFLYGPQGRGKTHLGIAAYRETMARHERLRYRWIDCLEYVDQLRRAGRHDSGTEAETVEDEATLADVLFVDDLCKGRPGEALTPFYIETIQRLLRTRHARSHRPTVITCEYGPTKLAKHLDGSLVSRIVEVGAILHVAGRDRRMT